MFIILFTTKSGYILSIGAVMADNSKWMRWFTPGIKSTGDYPRLVEYSTRRGARTHADSVLRYARKMGVLDKTSKSKVVPIYAANL